MSTTYVCIYIEFKGCICTLNFHDFHKFNVAPVWCVIDFLKFGPGRRPRISPSSYKITWRRKWSHQRKTSSVLLLFSENNALQNSTDCCEKLEYYYVTRNRNYLLDCEVIRHCLRSVPGYVRVPAVTISENGLGNLSKIIYISLREESSRGF